MDAPRTPPLLLVDADRKSARILARLLREDGFGVEVAFDGATAVKRLSSGPRPSALVTDVRMPHVDGVTLARFALARDPDMPVLFVTGYPQLLSKLFKQRPRPVVHTKPIDYGALSRQIALALESSPRS